MGVSPVGSNMECVVLLSKSSLTPPPQPPVFALSTVLCHLQGVIKMRSEM